MMMMMKMISTPVTSVVVEPAVGPVPRINELQPVAGILVLTLQWMKLPTTKKCAYFFIW
jgi:hypothetical protein